MTSSLTPAGSTRRWRRLRHYVLVRDAGACQLYVDGDGRHVEDGDPAAARRCGAAASHVDHVVGRRHADAAGMVELPTGRRVHVDALSNLRASCVAGNLGRPADHATPGRPNGGRRDLDTVRSWSW